MRMPQQGGIDRGGLAALRDTVRSAAPLDVLVTSGSFGFAGDVTAHIFVNRCLFPALIGSRVPIQGPLASRAVGQFWHAAIRRHRSLQNPVLARTEYVLDLKQPT